MSGEAQQEGQILSFDEILKADDIRREKVLVPEWGKGAAVFVQTMSGQARDVWEMVVCSIERDEDDKPKRLLIDRRNLRAWTVGISLCQEDGTPYIQVDRLATAADEKGVMDKIDALGQKSGAALDRLFGVCQRLSRLRDEDVEALLKDLKPDQVGV